MKKITLAFICFTICSLLTISCNKEQDTLAEVTVLTSVGSVVPGAKVRMFGQGTSDQGDVGNVRIDQEQVTDASGKTTFDFTSLYVPGQSGFAILNVEITKIFPDSSSSAEGIFKIVEEETNRKTFVLE